MPDITTLASSSPPTLPAEIIFAILSHHIEQTYIDSLSSLQFSTILAPSLATRTTPPSTHSSPKVKVNTATTTKIGSGSCTNANIPLFAHTTLRLARTSTLVLFELSGLLGTISAHVHARWIECVKTLGRVRAAWPWEGEGEGDASDVTAIDGDDGLTTRRTMSMNIKERERLLEAEVEGCWRDVCVVAGLRGKMRAVGVRVAGRRERERENRLREGDDRVREGRMEMKMKIEMEK